MNYFIILVFTIFGLLIAFYPTERMKDLKHKASKRLETCWQDQPWGSVYKLEQFGRKGKVLLKVVAPGDSLDNIKLGSTKELWSVMLTQWELVECPK